MFFIGISSKTNSHIRYIEISFYSWIFSAFSVVLLFGFSGLLGLLGLPLLPKSGNSFFCSRSLILSQAFVFLTRSLGQDSCISLHMQWLNFRLEELHLDSGFSCLPLRLSTTSTVLLPSGSDCCCNLSQDNVFMSLKQPKKIPGRKNNLNVMLGDVTVNETEFHVMLS